MIKFRESIFSWPVFIVHMKPLSKRASVACEQSKQKR